MVCHWQTGTHVTGATSRWYVLSPASGQLLHTVIYDQLARQCRSARQSRMPCLSMLLLVTNAVAWNKLSLAYFKSVITACTWHGASNAIKTKQSGQPSTSIPLSPLPFPPPPILSSFASLLILSTHPFNTRKGNILQSKALSMPCRPKHWGRIHSQQCSKRSITVAQTSSRQNRLERRHHQSAPAPAPAVIVIFPWAP